MVLMPQIWERSPRFTAGQVMTATSHLNALGRNIYLLRDDLLGLQPPFIGSFEENFYGYVRHGGTALSWEYEVTSNNVTVSIYVNGVLLRSDLRAIGTYSGADSLIGLGLTSGLFYAVWCIADAPGELIVWNLRETWTLSYPALVGFADESTPTAAQWAALSTTADLLAQELNQPYAAVPRTLPTYGKPIVGSLRYRARYLYYSVAAFTNPAEEITFYVDGTLVHTHHGGDTEAPVDLSGFGFTVGELYHLRINCAADPGLGLYGLCGWPDSSPALAGWASVPTWEYGDYVRSSSTKVVSNLADNLELLKPLCIYGNAVLRASIIAPTVNWQYVALRRWRWLLYKNAVVDGAPVGVSVGWNSNTETKQITLPDASNQPYGAYDLDGAGGLWPGTFYLVGGTQWAIEDIRP